MTTGTTPSEPSATLADPTAIRFVLCDLDGVVWLRRDAIAGAPDAVARLRASGRRVLFVTNNSMSTIADQEAALAAIGIPAEGDVLTSSQAAASLLAPGDTALVCGGPGVTEAVEAQGATAVVDVTDRSVDAVLVGLHFDFDYERMRIASSAVRGGARFVATNHDATYPTPDGPIPGAGALVASVTTAAGVEPVVAGKPHGPMAALVADRCGPGFTAGVALVVGDRFDTDGRFAAEIGCAYAMVRSGVTAPGDDAGGPCALDVADLAAVADVVLGG